MIRRYGAAALQWHFLDDSAWRRCLAHAMIAALRFAEQCDKSGYMEIDPIRSRSAVARSSTRR
jgi:hypothetical protein